MVLVNQLRIDLHHSSSTTCESRHLQLKCFQTWRSRQCSVLVQAKGPEQPPAASMQTLVNSHAERLFEASRSLKTPNKLMVAVAGSPGSGKTTTAHLVSNQINELAAQSNNSTQKGSHRYATVASMDGFHYYRDELDKMEDAEEAHARRGAHWTFNAAAFVQAVKQLRKHGKAVLPSFDHAYGDPVEEDVQILPETKVVIIEGNYMLLDEDPWSQLKAIFDESWYIDCDIDVAMQRVIGRQVGNGSPRSVAEKRVAGNDRPNAELIAKGKIRADYIIASLPLKKQK